MRVNVLLFAALRERIDRKMIDVDLPDGSTVADLRLVIADEYPSLAGLLPMVRIAVAAEFVGDDSPIPEGAEIALIPPVSGGDRPMIEITESPIDYEALTARVRSPMAGGICLFLGTVRELTGEKRTASLSYEAYPEMAIKKLSELEAEARRRWPIVEMAISHRVGDLELGAVAVAVAVSTPHRAEAFEACRWLIDTIKESVPIWKKEVWAEGGEEWVHPGIEGGARGSPAN